MMDLKIKSIIATGLLISSMSTPQAALIDRGGGLIYDDVLDVTWMQDALYHNTEDGIFKFNWLDAVTWAGQLEYYDPVRDVTWGNWRLPTTIDDPSSNGFDTSGSSSEMAYMYYINLGYDANPDGVPSDPNPSSDNYNPFKNLQYLGYWSGTAVDNPYVNNVWAFHYHFGYQTTTRATGDEMFAWALMDGDVADLQAVPLPPAILLMGSGLMSLAGLGALRNRRRNQFSA